MHAHTRCVPMLLSVSAGGLQLPVSRQNLSWQSQLPVTFRTEFVRKRWRGPANRLLDGRVSDPTQSPSRDDSRAYRRQGRISTLFNSSYSITLEQKTWDWTIFLFFFTNTCKCVHNPGTFPYFVKITTTNINVFLLEFYVFHVKKKKKNPMK